MRRTCNHHYVWPRGPCISGYVASNPSCPRTVNIRNCGHTLEKPADPAVVLLERVCENFVTKTSECGIKGGLRTTEKNNLVSARRQLLNEGADSHTEGTRRYGIRRNDEDLHFYNLTPKVRLLMGLILYADFT